MTKHTKLIFTSLTALSIACVSVYASGVRRHGFKKFDHTNDTSLSRSDRSIDFNSHKKPELSEEDKAAMLNMCKERLAKQLEDGKITEDEYNDAIAKMESGEFPHPPMRQRGMMKKPHPHGQMNPRSN